MKHLDVNKNSAIVRDPFWAIMRRNFKEYMIKHEGIKEEVAERKSDEFLRFNIIWYEFDTLIREGSFNKDGKRFLNFVNAYELTQPPYNFSNIGALFALCDMITKGPECEVFKSCCVSKLLVSENKDETQKMLDDIISRWKAPDNV